jgi:hypothetical protein
MNKKLKDIIFGKFDYGELNTMTYNQLIELKVELDLLVEDIKTNITSLDLTYYIKRKKGKR